MEPCYIVLGADGGLGSRVAEMFDDSHLTNQTFRTHVIRVGGRGIIPAAPPVNYNVDLCNTEDVDDLIYELSQIMPGLGIELEGIINCAGINTISPIPEVTMKMFNDTMAVNVSGFFYFCQQALQLMTDGGVICNVVSNASHMPMTHSAAYNASKGAAHILTKQMGRELKKTHGITVFGVSPNKLRGTHMSEVIDNRVCQLRGWTPEQAKQYQIAALPSGEETDPEAVARFIHYLASDYDMYRYLNCCIMPFGE